MLIESVTIYQYWR